MNKAYLNDSTLSKENQKHIYSLRNCPVCNGMRLHYLFSAQSYRIVRCEDCGLMMLNPQPSDEELNKTYGLNYFLLGEDEGGVKHRMELKQTTADRYLDLLVRYCGESRGKLLEIGCGQGDFLVRAATVGFEVTGVDYSADACDKARQKLNGRGRVICGEIDALEEAAAACYDVCALLDVIEHVRNPRYLMGSVHRLLKPGGVVFVAAPSLDLWSARLLKNNWMEFKPEHLFYFNGATLQTLLFHSGFGEMVNKACAKTLSVDYVAGHFERYPVKGLSPVVAAVRDLVPSKLRQKPISVVASEMIVMAHAQEKREKRKLSVVVPVFNEVATVEDALNKLLAKQVEGLDIEIIIVESNSADGTHEIVLPYKDHPRVKLILEDRPQGKGKAVRTGLGHITGDFVLIQDADLEYDLDDYEALLEPLMSGREAFVLGARHGGRLVKMRHFTDRPLQGLVLNIGHWFFTALIDLFFGLKLRDPFTMYKVFRRDCLYGLTFECNRFDFDWELLIKLVRKGYKPMEIPVNYRSRSFAQGKKVSMLRDPWTWLWALVKYRFCKIDLLAEVERGRGVG
jgi:SAM-dependent methyltransferase